MRSLYRRLTVTHTLVALLAVLLVALLASGLIVRAFRQTVSSEALRQSRAVAQRLSGPLAQLYLANRGWDGAAERIGTFIAERDIVDGRLVLADNAGLVVFDSAGALVGQRATPLIRQASVPVQVRDRVVGSLAVLPGEEQRRAVDQAFVRSLAWIVVIGSLAAIAVALAVALFVARRLVRPLGELTMAARRLAAGERHEPLAAPAEAELAELARAFNTMAAELTRQQELRRHMVADIAHELRTPLSVLRLQVESMEDGLTPASPQALGALGGELDLLARLVEDLRLLSLAEAGQLALSPQALDPREALEQTARAAAAGAQQRGVALRLEGGAPLPAIVTDPQRLAQILGNLVENALRYTPRGGAVTLRVTAYVPGPHPPAPSPSGREGGAAYGVIKPSPPSPAQGAGGWGGESKRAPAQGATRAWGEGGVVFEVSDSGPGIPAEDLPHIFERFYRADRARARETGGSGLGLAIVQRLAVALGGEVSVASPPGQGATFRVALPPARGRPAALPAPAQSERGGL